MIPDEIFLHYCEGVDQISQSGIQKKIKYKFDEFISNPEKYGSIERFLQLAIEATLDIGNHVIANEELGMSTFSRYIKNLEKELQLMEYLTGNYYHFYNRGFDGNRIFFDSQDYLYLLMTILSKL